MKKEQLGLIFEHIGFLIFILFCWYPFGFFLGGDAYFLGPINHSLELNYPYAGIGIFILFIGSFFRGKFKNISENQLLYFLFFLAIIGVLSNFSITPSYSILFLIFWAIGFFGSVLGNTFWCIDRWKQVIVVLSVLLGYIAYLYFPLWDISLNLLAIISIYGLVFMRLGRTYSYQWILIIFLLYIIAIVQNLGLIILTTILWVCIDFSPIYRRRRSKVATNRWIFLFFFFGFVLWFWQKETNINMISWNLPLFHDLKTFFLGIGEGEFILAIQNSAPFYILEISQSISKWGIVLTFFEQGIIGILLILSLGLSPLFFDKNRSLILIFLFFIFWILSSDFLGTGNGILLAMVFLLASKKDKRK